MTMPILTLAQSSTATRLPQGTADALGILAQEQDAGAAWAWLVAQEGPSMFRVACRMTGSAATADDVCQEAFLHVRAGARRFQMPTSGNADAAARAWLLRIVVSTASMWVRAERRRVAREQVNAASVRPEVVGPAEAGDGQAQLLQQVLGELPESQRMPVVLHHLAGQDFASIGQTLGISAGTARVRVHRAMSRLRGRLARLGVTAAGVAIFSRLTAGETLPPLAATARWQALIHSSLTPAVSSTAIFGGLTIMTKIALLCAALAVTGLVTVSAQSAWTEESHVTTGRVTVTGMAHALTDANGKLDPMALNATVTSTSNGASTVYYIQGWAGVIIAKQADGKIVAVTGTLGDQGGKKTVLARSIDVAINGVPIEKPAAPISVPTTAAHITVTGVVQALTDAKSKMDWKFPNATITSSENGSTTVYYVQGGAGIICAQQDNGKTVTVSGNLVENDGKKIIQGRSIDVSVDGVPIESKPTH